MSSFLDLSTLAVISESCKAVHDRCGVSKEVIRDTLAKALYILVMDTNGPNELMDVLYYWNRSGDNHCMDDLQTLHKLKEMEEPNKCSKKSEAS